MVIKQGVVAGLPVMLIIHFINIQIAYNQISKCSFKLSSSSLGASLIMDTLYDFVHSSCVEDLRALRISWDSAL